MKMMTTKQNNSLTKILSVVFAFAVLAITASQAQAQTQAVFNLRSLDGGNVTADELRGKVVVLAVGASWLPLSSEEAASIKRLAAKYALKNVEFYWVFTDSTSPKSRNYASDDDLKAFAKNNSLPVNLLRDPDGIQMKKLGVTQVPAFVVIDKNTKIFGSIMEGIEPDGGSTTQLEKKIVDALSAR